MKRNNGQSTLEYTIFIIILMGAFLAMQIYIKRGVQGRWKAAVDDLGDQYDPRFADTNKRHVIISNIETSIRVEDGIGGLFTFREDITNTQDRTTGFQGVVGF